MDDIEILLALLAVAAAAVWLAHALGIPYPFLLVLEEERLSRTPVALRMTQWLHPDGTRELIA
jgi:hypothetical protein